MRILAIVACLALLALIVGSANAQTRTASQSVTLGTVSCTDPNIRARVPPELHDRLKAGTGVWFDRKTYELCWLRDERRIIVVWEDGHVEALPATVFEAGA